MIMKTFIPKTLLLAAALLVAQTTMARNNDRPFSQPRSTMRVGIGWLSTDDILLRLGDAFGIVFSAGLYSPEYEDNLNVNYLFDYRYHFNDRWSLGASATYGDVSKALYSGSGDDRQLAKRVRQNYMSLLVQSDITYWRNDVVRLYGGLGLGVTSLYNCYLYDAGTAPVEFKDQYHFNFHLSAFGIECGRRVGGFLELGVGCRGLVNCGAYVRF